MLKSMLNQGMDALRPQRPYPRKSTIKRPNAGSAYDVHKVNKPGTMPQKGVMKSSNRYPRKSIKK